MQLGRNRELEDGSADVLVRYAPAARIMMLDLNREITLFRASRSLRTRRPRSQQNEAPNLETAPLPVKIASLTVIFAKPIV